jgi:hypothetical protein
MSGNDCIVQDIVGVFPKDQNNEIDVKNRIERHGVTGLEY